MLACFIRRIAHATSAALRAARDCLSAASKPAAPAVVAGALAYLARTKPELVAENAPLRQQLVILRRSVKRSWCCRHWSRSPRTLLAQVLSHS